MSFCRFTYTTSSSASVSQTWGPCSHPPLSKDPAPISPPHPSPPQTRSAPPPHLSPPWHLTSSGTAPGSALQRPRHCPLHCFTLQTEIRSTIYTGYNQSVTGRGSQRRQGSCYSTKTHVNSMILILRLNLTSLRNIYIESGLRWAPHTF